MRDNDKLQAELETLERKLKAAPLMEAVDDFVSAVDKSSHESIMHGQVVMMYCKLKQARQALGKDGGR